MDTTSARGGLLEGMKQADIRYVRTVYDPRRGSLSKYEVNSSGVLLQGRETRASTDGQGYEKFHNVPRGAKARPPSSWSQQCRFIRTVDNLPAKVGALPPARVTVTQPSGRGRPSSWSSLDQKRFCLASGKLCRHPEISLHRGTAAYCAREEPRKQPSSEAQAQLHPERPSQISTSAAD